MFYPLHCFRSGWTWFPTAWQPGCLEPSPDYWICPSCPLSQCCASCLSAASAWWCCSSPCSRRRLLKPITKGAFWMINLNFSHAIKPSKQQLKTSWCHVYREAIWSSCVTALSSVPRLLRIVLQSMHVRGLNEEELPQLGQILSMLLQHTPLHNQLLANTALLQEVIQNLTVNACPNASGGEKL